MIMQEINKALVLVFLALLSVFDIKTKQIPLWLILMFAAIFAGMCFVNGDVSYAALLVRLLPGVFLLAVAFATKQSMGYGDGAAVLIVGLLLDIWTSTALILLALLISAAASLFILLSKKGDRQTKLPFMPFMLAAWVVMLWR